MTQTVDTTYLEFFQSSHGKMHVGTLEDGMLCGIELVVEPTGYGQTLSDYTRDRVWWRLGWFYCDRCFTKAGVEYIKPRPYWTL